MKQHKERENIVIEEEDHSGGYQNLEEETEEEQSANKRPDMKIKRNHLKNGNSQREQNHLKEVEEESVEASRYLDDRSDKFAPNPNYQEINLNLD